VDETTKDVRWYFKKKTVKLSSHYVGFEVLTAVVMKSSIFWEIVLYSPLEVNELACYLLHAGFLFGLFFNPEDGGEMFLSLKYWLTFKGLHAVSQKTELLVHIVQFGLKWHFIKTENTRYSPGSVHLEQLHTDQWTQQTGFPLMLRRSVSY
jgi:hypothetical protein